MDRDKQAANRILRDISYIINNPLDKLGIYYNIFNDNIFNIQVLIIGPKDTPYYGGFYFFDFFFPNDYPHSPPHVEYKTTYDNIRFNPNLYNNGKVCLSLLNTWNGPSWTPCNNLSSILNCILAFVFVKNPLTNEPGFENNSEPILYQYNSIIEYESLRIATLHMLNNLPRKFEYFSEIINKYFYDNFYNYLNRLILLRNEKNYQNFVCKFYNLDIICNYQNIIDKFIKYYDNYQIIHCKNIKHISLLKINFNINKKNLIYLASKLNIITVKISDKSGKNIYKSKKEIYNSLISKIKNI